METSEKHLRAILTEVSKLQINFSDLARAIPAITKLSKAVQEADWYVRELDRCKYVYESGAICNERAVRVSFSIPCCETHAFLRDSSLK